MIYLVSNQTALFNTEAYSRISIEESLDILKTFNVIQFDTETSGKDAHIAELLCAQFGNSDLDIQIVVDTTTVDIKHYKDILESKYIIGHNLKFDLQFLYNYGIIPLKVYDTMIVEQLLYLGYPPAGKYKGVSFALNSLTLRYLNIELDKSVRGEIIWRGLDSRVIIYAANDVKYLQDIMMLQYNKCIKQECVVGAKLECDFVPTMAYLEWCGIKLDVNKWKLKMDKNQSDLESRKKALDKFAISLGNPKYYEINTQGDLFSGFDIEPKCIVNWSSSKQVIQIAKYLGFNTQVQDKKTGEDKDSVVEKHLKGQKGINDEFLKLYFDYQEASKVCSTYGQNYIDAINPITGRIHTVFRQLGCSSGRMTCGDSRNKNAELAKIKSISKDRCGYVQLQTLPADDVTRESFVSEPGNLFCSCDYGALESRLGADIYDEPAMINEYLYGSGDKMYVSLYGNI